MDQVDCTTNAPRRKGSHLTLEERVIIQTRRREKKSLRTIAREIHCSPSTVANELKRGQVLLYNGKRIGYRAAVGQDTYVAHRSACGRRSDALVKGAFLEYVERQFRQEHHSLDACVGRALQSGLFTRKETVCTKTLYNYVALGLLGKIKNIDLPLRVKRKNVAHRNREHKKKLGRSIEERDASIEERTEFGHFECDLVLGGQTQGEVLLTLVERKTRCLFLRKSKDKKSATILKAFHDLMTNTFPGYFDTVFLTLTTDNGSEFSRLPELEKDSNLRVYFTHPFSPYEKGTNENHNGLIR